MHNLSLIEEYYKKISQNLYEWIPEGIYYINLELLYSFDLLHFQPFIEYKNKVSFFLMKEFHVVESADKITLINDKFVIWIISNRTDQDRASYILIALNQEDKEPQLEVAFIASGIYNNSNLIIKVLERFLIDIQETEMTLHKLHKTGS